MESISAHRPPFRPLSQPRPRPLAAERIPATSSGTWLAALTLLVVVLTAFPAPANAQGECIFPYFWGQLTGDSPRSNNCFGANGFRCYKGCRQRAVPASQESEL